MVISFKRVSNDTMLRLTSKQIDIKNGLFKERW